MSVQKLRFLKLPLMHNLHLLNYYCIIFRIDNGLSFTGTVIACTFLHEAINLHARLCTLLRNTALQTRINLLVLVFFTGCTSLPGLAYTRKFNQIAFPKRSLLKWPKSNLTPVVHTTLIDTLMDVIAMCSDEPFTQGFHIIIHYACVVRNSDGGKHAIHAAPRSNWCNYFCKKRWVVLKQEKGGHEMRSDIYMNSVNYKVWRKFIDSRKVDTIRPRQQQPTYTWLLGEIEFLNGLDGNWVNGFAFTFSFKESRQLARRKY